MQAQVFDLNVLATFIGNDPALQRSMLQKFIEQTRQTLVDIHDLLQHNHASAIGALGHKLKASARTVGATVLTELFERLEMAGKAEEWAAINETVLQITEMMEKLEHQVDRLDT